MNEFTNDFSRRQLLKAGVATSVVSALGTSIGCAATPTARAAAPGPILRSVPKTGEKLPVVGVGTNAFGVTAPEELAGIRAVLNDMSGLGGSVIDTARVYGSSEEVIGRLLKELGNRGKYFLATKTPMGGDMAAGRAVLEESFKRLQVDKVDLLQIHNFAGLNELMAHFVDYKKEGKIRYIGISTSMDSQYEQMLAAIDNQPLDFIQVDYSIGNRGAAERILPMAKDKGLAVLINVPFGGRGRSFFPRVAGKPLPDFAKDIGATSWAQFFLKYIIANSAVTAAIPGTTTAAHLIDNQAAGRGAVPDAAMVKKMEEFWDAMPSA
jgi:aryl-alcohol dehydrogenase-like predicted oxidoreductase